MLVRFLYDKKKFFSPLGVGGILLFANCLLPIANSFSQSDILRYAHQVVDTLASPSMHGRGYVNKGDSIAADYIKKEFEKFGLKSVGEEFSQRFKIPQMNLFPYKIFVKVNGKKLISGKDYLIHPYSNSKKKKYKSFLYEVYPLRDSVAKASVNHTLGETAIIFSQKDTSVYPVHEYVINSLAWPNAPLVILVRDKLTYEIGQYPMHFQKDFGAIEILREKLPEYITSLQVNIKNQYVESRKTKNVIGYIKGIQYPDSFIVFTAHYDHLGQMGKDVYFPGANDNASGCAMLLSLAKYYSQHPPKYSVAFMAFGGEEVGLLGSKYYVEHPLFPLKQIKFLVNMDIMGTGDEGIKVVNATVHKKEFDELVKINEEKKLLPSIQPRGKAANSDHYFFEEAGVKTFFIYTLGGIKAYHDIYDRPETLPLTKFEEVYKLLIEFVRIF